MVQAIDYVDWPKLTLYPQPWFTLTSAANARGSAVDRDTLTKMVVFAMAVMKASLNL